MVRLAMVLAFAAVFSAGLPSPGLYLAISLGIAAIGTGLVAYRRRSTPGAARLVGAAAMLIGSIGLSLGVLRVALALAAIGRIDGMLG